MTLEATSPRLPPKIDSQESFLHACNRRGRDIVCKTTVYPLVMRDDATHQGHESTKSRKAWRDLFRVFVFSWQILANWRGQAAGVRCRGS